MIESMKMYLTNHSDEYLSALLRHIEISLISVAIATIIGVSLGIFCSNRDALYHFFTGVFSILRVIPSLAILVICIPFFGIGILPAVIALIVLAIPPILINTATGFKMLPASVLETAFAMGMGKVRIFFKVALPLALPMILSGVRTALSEVIASATLAAYIGAGGLGVIIFTGLGLNRVELLLVGGISVATLSLTSELLSAFAVRVARNATHL